MAEPRKVQFVTLSAFAAGAAADSRRRRLEDTADFNFGGAPEVEAATTVAGGGDGSGRDAAERKTTVRLQLCLSEPDDLSFAEFNYSELVHNLQTKNNSPTLTSAHNPNDPFDDGNEQLQDDALAKKFENKYGNTAKKRRKDRLQDLIDIGFGYDETDPFIDNSEAYDELVPASLTTKLGGFYINTGTLQFKTASDSDGEDDMKMTDGGEQVIKKNNKKEGSDLEEKNQMKNEVPKQGVTALSLHRTEKRRRKKMITDSLSLAAMLHRFTQEKEKMRKNIPCIAHPGLAGGENNNPHSANSTNLLASNLAHSHSNAGTNDHSLTDITSDPAVMSLLGSTSEKELQDLLGDLDFSLIDTDQQPAMVTARENGVLGVGVPAHKGGTGGGSGRGLGTSSGLYSPPTLPNGLPTSLTKRIEDLREASRQFDQEGRKKFFTLDMNNILLDIELQVQEQSPEVQAEIYSHMEAFVPCNKEALLKRLKKLSLNIQDDRLRTPLLKLKLAVCSVMPEQIARYTIDCKAKAAKLQSEEGDKNGSGEEDDEKPGKRVFGPRKKFFWDEKLRNLLCSLVRVKMSCYEMEKQCTLSLEDYLKAFLENEVKPLWPKGWMQARILLKESFGVHGHLTGSLVKRRIVPGPKARAKERLWIHKPSLTLTSTQQPLSSSPSELICLSDSLDEDLTAPSLDSIAHILALPSSVSKILGSSDSPLSPPPLQIPTSSPPPVTPHYPSVSHLSASGSTAQQHSLSKTETAPAAAVPAGNLPATTTTTLPTSSSTSSTVLSPTARVQAAGLSLPSRTADGSFGPVKGSGSIGQTQTQKHATMASPTYRAGSVIGGSGKLHPHPSSSPPKQWPPPTASSQLPPHQKGFASPVVLLGTMGASQGLAKVKAGSSSSSTVNSSTVSSSITSASSPTSQPRSTSASHPGLQSFCSPSPVASSSSPTSHCSPSPQGKNHSHHHHQPNFITPMQVTLTKSSHSSNSSPIIKLTPRPPAPAPPPSSSPSSSPAHPLSHQMLSSPQQHQFSAKTSKTFRAPFSVSGGVQGKQSQATFTAAQKTQPTVSSSSIITNQATVAHVCTLPDKTPPTSVSSLSANHGQRQRVVGGATQSSKTRNGWATSASLGSSSTTSHHSQVILQESAGAPLLASPTTLSLGFGMLGGLVPVSLPFPFPSLLSFNPPGAPGAPAPPTSNSGFPLAQSDLMDLYKSLQSGSQAALPPHLQLAFSDANQSQSGEMKRKSH
ncbi:ubinuclein-2-like isoform X2 [Thalassophryne amazonica]|uniref:ubinuclein-2-like isoform X2 n=1 Tax=Thalassophryne amazonica TaxID=390379 RepID=UPI0014721311|nr:ubinuclein-2-like isoform X2 [Thalassophryne amazonica]